MRKNSLLKFLYKLSNFPLRDNHPRSVKVLLSRTAVYKLAEQCPKSFGQHGLIVTETRLPAYEGTNIIKGP